jgi:hypothetical protein
MTMTDHGIPAPTHAENLDDLAVTTIRTLCMDAVQAANSGHPGTPMAMAPVAYTLWQQFLRFDPADPIWPDRDRFVLSAGHASTLMYALLHLSRVTARAKAKSGSEPLSGEFEGGHGPCGGLKVSDAFDHQRVARAREFIFPARPVPRCLRVRLVSGEAGLGRIGRAAAGPGLGPRSA